MKTKQKDCANFKCKLFHRHEQDKTRLKWFRGGGDVFMTSFYDLFHDCLLLSHTNTYTYTQSQTLTHTQTDIHADIHADTQIHTQTRAHTQRHNHSLNQKHPASHVCAKNACVPCPSCAQYVSLTLKYYDLTKTTATTTASSMIL